MFDGVEGFIVKNKAYSIFKVPVTREFEATLEPFLNEYSVTSFKFLHCLILVILGLSARADSWSRIALCQSNNYLNINYEIKNYIMSQDKHIVHGVVELYKETKLFGDGEKARELSDIVKQHALAGIGISLIPVPGADLAALAVNTWTMYVRINKVIGISFSDNALRSIASGVIANIVSTLPALALGLAAEGLLKFIPGIGTIGGMAVGAAVNVGVMYAAGKVYIQALEKLINSNKSLTEDGVAETAKTIAKEKSFVEGAYKEGKEYGKANQKK